jgi:hypothetical protein
MRARLKEFSLSLHPDKDEFEPTGFKMTLRDETRLCAWRVHGLGSGCVGFED